MKQILATKYPLEKLVGSFLNARFFFVSRIILICTQETSGR
jgi:hypothetical protein